MHVFPNRKNEETDPTAPNQMAHAAKQLDFTQEKREQKIGASQPEQLERRKSFLQRRQAAAASLRKKLFRRNL